MITIAIAPPAAAMSSSHSSAVPRCKLVISEFNTDNASVIEMQDYASCVKTVHPIRHDSVNFGEVIVFVIIAYCLIHAFVLWGNKNCGS